MSVRVGRGVCSSRLSALPFLPCTSPYLGNILPFCSIRPKPLLRFRSASGPTQTPPAKVLAAYRRLDSLAHLVEISTAQLTKHPDHGKIPASSFPVSLYGILIADGSPAKTKSGQVLLSKKASRLCILSLQSRTCIALLIVLHWRFRNTLGLSSPHSAFDPL